MKLYSRHCCEIVSCETITFKSCLDISRRIRNKKEDVKEKEDKEKKNDGKWWKDDGKIIERKSYTDRRKNRMKREYFHRFLVFMKLQNP